MYFTERKIHCNLKKVLYIYINKNQFLSVYTNPQFTSDDREILHTGVVNTGQGI